MTLKLKCHKLKCNQNWNVTKTKISPKLNVTMFSFGTKHMKKVLEEIWLGVWVGRKGSYIPATPTGEDTARSFVIPGRYRSWRESTPLCVGKPLPGWTDTGRSAIWTSPGNLRRRRRIFLIIFCRFFWFFLYLIDMRNMSKESKMRWALDPRSKERQAHINTIPVTYLKPGAVTEVSCTS